MTLRQSLEHLVDGERVLTRAIDLIAYASDASLYRLVPRAVVQPVSEEEVIRLLAFAAKSRIPLTFRTAGTSLSGQAVTDGLLLDLSKYWGAISVLEKGAKVRVQPGVIGRIANAHLAPYGRRIGPDPASIDTCMMGGIIANNSSGMCCGIHENAYRTLSSMRLILANGTVLDTRETTELGELGYRILAIRDDVRADSALFERIRAKYRIKNTMGYALNAFLDYDDPVQILAHLVVGSEGTLAFISEAELHTLPDYPHKRAGYLFFADLETAIASVKAIENSGARAIELFDDASVQAVKDDIGIELPAGGCALLVEYQAETREELERFIALEAALSPSLKTLSPPRFTEDPAARAALWKVRKGLLPAAGATKRSGETVIIEDVAFPLEELTASILALKRVLVQHGYGRALVFGHAKDGNVHFCLTQSFNTAEEVARYDRFMVDLAKVTVAHHGSLKAEHGTGRNMAPFVEAEWGKEAYAIMKRVKALLDPEGVLNPGVILNADPRAHVKHLKDLPAVEEEVDRCIECGFCEPVCPSRRLTLTPRQRIVVRREIARSQDPAMRAELIRDFQYSGLDTCATDGLCATACPVKIDTGALVKRLRFEKKSARALKVAGWLARNFARVEQLAKLALRLGHFAKKLGFPIPLSNIPRVPRTFSRHEKNPELIFVSSCTSRVLGQPLNGDRTSAEIFLLLAERSGVRVAVPKNSQCCGLPFSSKGFPGEGELLASKMIDSLRTWSDGGRIPVVIDGSSCLYALKTAKGSVRLLDPIEALRDLILPRLKINPLNKHIAIHPTCAARKMELAEAMQQIAKTCATKVTLPINLACCGMAGDRGLMFPELPLAATELERKEIAHCDAHYSNNLTCEIGLSAATGREYRSMLYLVEEATRST